MTGHLHSATPSTFGFDNLRVLLKMCGPNHNGQVQNARM